MKIGPEAAGAVPALCQALEDDDTSIRAKAIDILGEIGPAAKNGVGALTRVLQGGNDELSEKAALALGKTGPSAKEAVTSLVAAFNSRFKDGKPSNTARATGIALGKMGSEAKEAAGALRPLLQAKDTRFRLVAATKLYRIARVKEMVIPD